jgi:hypothetical protein
MSVQCLSAVSSVPLLTQLRDIYQLSQLPLLVRTASPPLGSRRGVFTDLHAAGNEGALLRGVCSLQSSQELPANSCLQCQEHHLSLQGSRCSNPTRSSDYSRVPMPLRSTNAESVSEPGATTVSWMELRRAVFRKRDACGSFGLCTERRLQSGFVPVTLPISS